MRREKCTYNEDRDDDVENALALVSIDAEVDVDGEENLDRGVDRDDDIIARTNWALDTI